jgi:HEPN domain-containing protein
MSVSKPDYWLEMAEYDIESARVMQNGGRYLYVGFLCHLTAEKAIKSIIAQDGTIPMKTHTLSRLAEQAGLKDILTDSQKALLDELHPLNIEARYSAYKDKIAEVLTCDYCGELIKRTEEFLSWIKKRH